MPGEWLPLGPVSAFRRPPMAARGNAAQCYYIAADFIPGRGVRDGRSRSTGKWPPNMHRCGPKIWTAARTHGATASRPEVMRVVGEQWSARSHEIRDLLSRNVVPFGFYPGDAGAGRALLEQAGATAAALQVIIMSDWRVLENPSNTQIAEAIGVRTRPGAGLYDVAVIGAGQPAWRPRFTRRPRACPRWCWSQWPSAARPERARTSATTSASRPG
jgi:hypothetical protein